MTQAPICTGSYRVKRRPGTNVEPFILGLTPSVYFLDLISLPCYSPSSNPLSYYISPLFSYMDLTLSSRSPAGPRARAGMRGQAGASRRAAVWG
jgi:hypothetical protein